MLNKLQPTYPVVSLTGKIALRLGLLFVFWIFVFDAQRIFFTIHNLSKFYELGFFNWLGAFVFSFRLDMATAGYLSILPGIFLILATTWEAKWAYRVFAATLLFEAIVCALIHAGEINAYPEWNHKLTGRVFTHLSNPDEVVRTADYGMMFWFFIYAGLEIILAFKLRKWFFPFKTTGWELSALKRTFVTVMTIPVAFATCLLLARGGLQPIPINTDAAIYTNDYVANDLSVNSTYYFAKSFLLYNRTDIDEFIPEITDEQAAQTQELLYGYNTYHENWILDNKRPNFVFIILESWTGNAMGCLTKTTTATPHFDELTKDGLFFSNIYGVSGTSEIGNSAIFSGYPGVPEISITMQPDKHRKIPCLNEDLEKWGYTSAYLFSGDLKYGNIGGYFTDHGFDHVEDENNFPKSLGKGKLNYYDEDLYDLLIAKMNQLPQPFLQCGFTGSTHSPYDFPNAERFSRFGGVEGKFHNSMLYADSCLYDFLQKAKKQSWYANTVFVFVADHGHASNLQQNPSASAYNRIPLLIWGEPLKQEYKGKTIHKLGSQADIVRTLLYQMGGDYQRYKWAKDLLNPNAPEFALHTINRGYGWVTPKGNFTYHMENKYFVENTYSEADTEREFSTCQSLLALIYEEYKKL
ncbi:MAG: sulfatase-like hydrolase/transferase [Crocinitomicaceae bacterium]|nr:sulfatase-like hydrolase/transferase [Crocinitomicaceae bacterium]